MVGKLEKGNRLRYADSAILCNAQQHLFLTRNKQVSGSSPLLGSVFPCILLADCLLVEGDRAVRVGDGLTRMPTAAARRDGPRTPPAATAVGDR
jgi:hypothetical protein